MKRGFANIWTDRQMDNCDCRVAFTTEKSTLPLAIVENEIRNKVRNGNPSYDALGPLFLIMPFPMLHQMFVLHSPEHSCNHPPIMEAENMGINQTIWQVWKIIKNI